MLHRSLVWYCCVGFVDFLTYLKLLYHGFHFHRTPLSQFFTLFPFRPQILLTPYKSPAKHTTYWHRPHTSASRLPVVFIHGIGIGLYPYTNFLSELNSVTGIESSDPNDQVGILAIELMPISFRITHSALGRVEMCGEIDQILLKHFSADQKFVLVSHSYGTVITTHLLKTPSIARRIGPVVLVDPVSILLHLPDVAYNFTRRQPKEANEHQLYYFASMDMNVSHTLSRHFFWNENVLWLKDLEGRNVTVCLGGRDLIVDTEAVGRYLSQAQQPDNKNRSLPRPAGDNTYDGHSPNVLGNSTGNGGEFGVSMRGGEVAGEIDEEWKYRPWRGSGIEILWFDDLDHAQIFDKPATRGRLIHAINTYCKSG